MSSRAVSTPTPRSWPHAVRWTAHTGVLPTAVLGGRLHVARALLSLARGDRLAARRLRYVHRDSVPLDSYCTHILLRRKRDLPFSWIFVAFGVFIVSCGVTHTLDVWTLWTPLCWLSGGVKAITAISSLRTAVMLIALVPRVNAELRKIEARFRAPIEGMANGFSGSSSIRCLAARRRCAPIRHRRRARVRFAGRAILRRRSNRASAGRGLPISLPAGRGRGSWPSSPSSTQSCRGAHRISAYQSWIRVHSGGTRRGRSQQSSARVARC